MMLMLQCFVFF